MVHKPGNPPLTGGINYIFFIYSEEIASTLVLHFLSRMIFTLSFVCHAEPHYLTYIFDDL